MRKGNGKTEVKLDLEHELPAAEGEEEAVPGTVAGGPAEVSAISETEKLKAERDALLDRLARLQDALLKMGVQPIVSVGQPFDPRVHEAIEMVDTTEVADHHVLDELQRGYKYKDKLLRPAMVRVARNSRG